MQKEETPAEAIDRAIKIFMQLNKAELLRLLKKIGTLGDDGQLTKMVGGTSDFSKDYNVLGTFGEPNG